MEEWKLFDNYQISNFGNCKKKNKALKCSIQNRGYKYFQLQKDGKRINYLIHHLVALLFIGERPDGLVIDHIDRDKLNNHVSNLRYVSQEINIQNSKKYRNDIQTKDKKERKAIFQKEYDMRIGHNKGIRRERGTGSIQKRENGTYRAILDKNKIRYSKHFKTKEEAEEYLNSLVI